MESTTVSQNDAQLSVMQRIIAVFTSPAKSFACIETAPKTIVPIIIISVISLGFVLLAGDIIKNETLTQQEAKFEEQNMEPAQIDQALAMTEKVMTFTMPLFAVLGPIFIVTIVAGVFMFVGNVILGGKASFKKVFSVTAWAWLILTFSTFIILPLIMAKGSMLVSLSLAAFLPDSSRTTFLYNLLAKVDIFFIWWMAVYSIGLAVIYKMRTQKVAVAVVSVYVIYALVASWLASAFA